MKNTKRLKPYHHCWGCGRHAGPALGPFQTTTPEAGDGPLPGAGPFRASSLSGWILFLVLVFGLTTLGARAAETGPGIGCQGPPVQYVRDLEMRITDLHGRPVSGVTLDLELEWGAFPGPMALVSDQDGFIRFQIIPVVKDDGEGKNFRDRFLTYQLQFSYLLLKKGHLSRTGRVEDSQEYAGFSDPLYQGLNRRPSDKVLGLAVTMPAYLEYFAQNPGPGISRFHALIDDLTRPQGVYELLPGTLGSGAKGRLTLGLVFHPLLDPQALSVTQAGTLLLKRVVADSLGLLRSHVEQMPGLIEIEYRVTARFQYRESPHATPEELKYSFRFPAADAANIVAWAAGNPTDLSRLKTAAGGSPLHLNLR